MLIVQWTGPHHIGIIAPYHAQCQKILAALPDKLKGVKVGSVEEFQGQVCLLVSLTSRTVLTGLSGTPRDYHHDCAKQHRIPGV